MTLCKCEQTAKEEELGAIEMQSRNRRAACCALAHKHQRVVSPVKVFLPEIAARIKKEIGVWRKVAADAGVKAE